MLLESRTKRYISLSPIVRWYNKQSPIKKMSKAKTDSFAIFFVALFTISFFYAHYLLFLVS